MLGKITSLANKYEKCPLSRLKRVFQSDINYQTYDEFVPPVKNQIIGNLPSEMIDYIVKNFPEQKGELIKKFQKGLALTAMFTRANWRKMQREGKIIQGLDRLAENEKHTLLTQMRNVLFSNIHEILPKNSAVQFELLGNGAMGHAFKLSIKDASGKRLMPDAAMKIYHDVQNDIAAEMHGNYAEANISTFLKRALGHKMEKSQFAAHYMSDLKSGYTLSEFIHHDGEYTYDFVDYSKKFGVNSLDAVKNFISGKIFDMGGFKKQWNFCSDKVTMRYYKKLVNNPQITDKLLERYQALADNPKTPHQTKIQDAIDLFQISRLNKRNYIQEYMDLWKKILTDSE